MNSMIRKEEHLGQGICSGMQFAFCTLIDIVGVDDGKRE